MTPFSILCLTGFLAIFSSTISKSPVLPLFAAHLGAGPSGVGLIAAVSAFTGVIASIPAGIMADRIGKRRMLVFSAVVFSSAPVLYLFVSDIAQLAVVRLYHGLATAIFLPVAMAMVSDLFAAERGEKMGWFSTSTLLGRFVAPMAGGSIIGALASSPALPFKVVYGVCAAAGFITLLLAVRIPARTGQPLQKRTWTETTEIFRGVISSRTIVITSVVEAAILFAYGTFETFLPLYSIEAGLSAYEVGIFLSSQVITLALTKPVMGRFSDRHGRRPQILFGALAGAVCIGGFSVSGSFIPFLFLSILFGLSLSIVTSATSALIADVSRDEGRGSAMGVLGSIMDLGHTSGPLVSGVTATYLGLSKAFIGASVVVAAAAVVFAVSADRSNKHHTVEGGRL
ncbi:MAG TPA: MFS transporter [Dissulfurispiraceae bacterium]|nr:MFS transporter [Dissulfurispiraceae bacterium]